MVRAQYVKILDRLAGEVVEVLTSVEKESEAVCLLQDLAERIGRQWHDVREDAAEAASPSETTVEDEEPVDGCVVRDDNKNDDKK